MGGTFGLEVPLVGVDSAVSLSPSAVPESLEVSDSGSEVSNSDPSSLRCIMGETDIDWLLVLGPAETSG